MTCNGSGFAAKVFTPPAGTQWIEYFIECQSTLANCKAQAPPQLALAEAAVTISDSTLPTLAIGGGSMVTGPAVGAIGSVVYGASDNVGTSGGRG